MIMDRLKASALQRMYKNGEWSDLTISTATKDFHVHKSVVCPALPFFHAACTRGFQEEKTGRIQLEENERVIDMLLRHLYELDFNLLHPCPRRTEDQGRLKDETVDLVTLGIAADKYQVNGLHLRSYVAAEERIYFMKSASILTELGSWIWSDDCPQAETLQSTVCTLTARKISDILRNDAAWTTLCSSQRYLKDVVQHMWISSQPTGLLSQAMHPPY